MTRALGMALAAWGCLSQGLALAQAPAPAPVAAPVSEPESNGAAVQPTAPREMTPADVEAWLDGFMPNAIEQADIAGAVVAVVKDGQVLVQKGYGFADVSARRRMDAETLVRPGSTSKLFTWTAVMQLVEQGKISLDADVNQYLDFKIPDRGGKPITVRNLMTHTPGFEEQIKGLITSDDQDVPELGTLLKTWVPERIFDPGTMPAYSNYATALAGYIVERVSGEPFADYIGAHVFAPLGMRSSSFHQPLPAELRDRMSQGYPVASKPSRPFEVIGMAPAGSLSSTAADMAKFMIAHLQDGQYGEARILQPETARQMHETALTLLPRVNRMLLGFYESNYKGRRVISHGGDTLWFHSDLHLFVDDGIGLFVSFNSPGKDGASGRLRQTLFQELADRYLPAPGWREDAPSSVDAATVKAHAALLAGHYVPSRRKETNFLSLINMVGEAKAIDNGDGTVSISLLTSPSGVPLRWREIEPFLWQQEHGADLMAAQVTNGRVSRIAVGFYAPIIVFEPPAPWKNGAWLLPASIAALAVLLLTSVAWPVSALTRRHYGRAYALAGPEARTHRWVRIAATASVLNWAAWAGIIVAGLSNLELLSSKTDGWLWVLRILSPLVFVGAAAVGLWYAWVTLRSGRRRLARFWAVLVALALLVSLWVALAFNVLTSGVNY